MQTSIQGRAALLMNPKTARGDVRLPDRYSSRFIAPTNVCESPERKCHHLQGTYFRAPYWCFRAVFCALEQGMMYLRAMSHYGNADTDIVNSGSGLRTLRLCVRA